VRLFSFNFPLPPCLLKQSVIHVLLIIYTLGLAHDAVLRLTRPGEVRAYIVDPQFSMRADAMKAMCLAALGRWGLVRAVSGALETKIFPKTKTIIFEIILPLLTTDDAKFWPSRLPEIV
jgi:hypothetical protein